MTTDLEEKLINLVKNYPCLFEKSDSMYKNSKHKEKIWEEISTGFENELSARGAKELWTKLRSQFMGFLRRLIKPSGSGKGRRPYFRHEEAMAFIKDSIDPDGTVFSNVREEDEDDQDEQPENSAVEIDVLDVPHLPANTQEANSMQLVPRSKEPSEPRSHKKGAKRKMDEFEKDVLQLLTSEEDEFELYCKSLVPKLRRISDADKRAFLSLQNNINNLIFDSEFNL